MTVARASAPRQAFLAVAALVGLFVAAILWGTVYLVAMRDLQTAFETKTRTLNILKRQTQQRMSGSTDNVQSAGRAVVISAPTETVAASELHKTILASLEQAGGAIHSIQAEATSDVVGDGLRRLNAEINFDGSIGALQKVLFDLETAVPFIFVESVLVQPTSTTAPDAKAREATLRVTLVASSYWKSFEPGADNR